MSTFRVSSAPARERRSRLDRPRGEDAAGSAASSVMRRWGLHGRWKPSSCVPALKSGGYFMDRASLDRAFTGIRAEGPIWRSAAGQRLCRPRHQAAVVLVQTPADRTYLSGSTRHPRPLPPSFRRYDRCHEPDSIVQAVRPTEIYNLAAQSHVQSAQTPEVYRQCRRARHAAAARGHPHSGKEKSCRFYQASRPSSMARCRKRRRPRRPLSSALATRRRSSSYGRWSIIGKHTALHASNGILFNHESRSGAKPLTRKVTGPPPRSSSAFRTSFIG